MGLEIQLNKMNKLVEEKNSTITDFEQKLKEQDKQTAGLLLKVENLETFAKENNKKQIKFENNIQTLESRLTKQEKYNNMLNDKLDKIVSTVEIAEKKKFKCSECEYEATSERGLKCHIGRKHQTDKSNYPKTCDLCDYVIKNAKEMKKHMLSHSFNRI